MNQFAKSRLSAHYITLNHCASKGCDQKKHHKTITSQTRNLLKELCKLYE